MTPEELKMCAAPRRKPTIWKRWFGSCLIGIGITGHAWAQFEIYSAASQESDDSVVFARTLSQTNETLKFHPFPLLYVAVKKASLKTVGNTQVIALVLTTDGSRKLAQLQRENLGKRVGLIFRGGYLVSAPTIEGPATIREPIELPISLPAEETKRLLEDFNTYYFNYFASDLLFPFEDESHRPVAVEKLPQRELDQLAALHSGVTRHLVDVLCNEQGDCAALIYNEYVVKQNAAASGHIGLRFAFRPVDMPLDDYNNPDRRRAWLLDQRPRRSPDDIVMRVSKPFETVGVISDGLLEPEKLISAPLSP